MNFNYWKESLKQLFIRKPVLEIFRAKIINRFSIIYY